MRRELWTFHDISQMILCAWSLESILSNSIPPLRAVLRKSTHRWSSLWLWNSHKNFWKYELIARSSDCERKGRMLFFIYYSTMISIFFLINYDGIGGSGMSKVIPNNISSCSIVCMSLWTLKTINSVSPIDIKSLISLWFFTIWVWTDSDSVSWYWKIIFG